MSHDVTNLLIQLSQGNKQVTDEIFPLIYDELKRIAGGYLKNEREEHTLQPTALVHEAYLKLIDQTRVSWQNRAHFLGVAAQVMRRILVDHARHRGAEKRFGRLDKLQLNENIDKVVEMDSELVALDDALKSLAKVDPALAKLVELRFFGALTFEETAEVMGISPRTAKRHWQLARAWLYRNLSQT